MGRARLEGIDKDSKAPFVLVIVVVQPSQLTLWSLSSDSGPVSIGVLLGRASLDVPLTVAVADIGRAASVLVRDGSRWECVERAC